MNLYIALRFHEREDLHLTLLYVPEADLDELVRFVQATIDRRKPRPFRMSFSSVPRMLGANGRVRTLVPAVDQALPTWLFELTPAHWVPHVTCDDPTLPDLLVVAVSIMHRKQEIQRWSLLRHP